MEIFKQYISSAYGKNINIIYFTYLGGHIMEDFLWNSFMQSGDVTTFLAYRTYINENKKNNEKFDNKKDGINKKD